RRGGGPPGQGRPAPPPVRPLVAVRGAGGRRGPPSARPRCRGFPRLYTSPPASIQHDERASHDRGPRSCRRTRVRRRLFASGGGGARDSVLSVVLSAGDRVLGRGARDGAAAVREEFDSRVCRGDGGAEERGRAG